MEIIYIYILFQDRFVMISIIGTAAIEAQLSTVYTVKSGNDAFAVEIDSLDVYCYEYNKDIHSSFCTIKSSSAHPPNPPRPYSQLIIKRQHQLLLIIIEAFEAFVIIIVYCRPSCQHQVIYQLVHQMSNNKSGRRKGCRRSFEIHCLHR